MGVDIAASTLDEIKRLGYRFSTYSGTTFSMDESPNINEKPAIVAEAKKHEKVVIDQYADGLISEDERYRKVIEIWESALAKISKAVEASLNRSESIHDIVVSGARGSISQMTQNGGMKGLIINTAGRTIDYPIIPSYKEGLSPIEYFIINHGARKGLTDTALNTAKAGYLTRKLVVVAQDVVVTEEDCGTKKGYMVRAESIDGMVRPITANLYGRVLADTLKDKDGNVIFKRGTLITKDELKAIEGMHISEALVRSPMACESRRGLCRQCYGLDLGRNHLVKYGEAVGVVAAQAIGEPGTQLTLRTMHAGGVAGSDITMGLPRVEELFECRTIKIPAVLVRVAGEVTDIKKDEDDNIIVEVTADETRDGDNGSKTLEYPIDHRRVVTVKKGQRVSVGDVLTDGSVDPHELFHVAGFDKAQEYIIREISKVYELQSAPVARKHLEVIIRQMFGRRSITKPGSTRFTTGEMVENYDFIRENETTKQTGGEPAEAKMLLMGIQEASLSSKSWMSAAAFQHTTRTLVSSATRGEADELRGLMENVMIGNLIPAGTGLDPTFITGLHPEPVLAQETETEENE
jgi:DNA-directed RNA polymerase subunit beta'